jgi:hypothetical protein
MTAAPRWSRAGVPGELADVIRRLLRGLLAACRLASTGIAGTGGRQVTAMGFQAGQYRELHAPGTAGPPGSLPRRRAHLCPDADASAVSRQPGRPPAGAGPELPRYRERGRARPPQLAAGSFISCGAFAGPDRAQPHARLPGAVLRAAPRGCAVTGKPVTVAGSAVP